MRLFFLCLFLAFPFASCSVNSFYSVNSSATISLASGWQASVVSHHDSIEVNHQDGAEEATFYTAGHEIIVGPDRIVIDGEVMVSMPGVTRLAVYEVDAFSVRLEAAK